MYEESELSSTLFRDSKLKNNSKLILRRAPDPIDEGGEVDGEEEGEDEIMEMDEGFEGGEDELVDMDEEGEAEIEDPEAVIPEDPEAKDD